SCGIKMFLPGHFKKLLFNEAFERTDEVTLSSELLLV
uniref:Uncharacterized protein n=1 Tax=Aegilops tauschii subsp. strangulata TaxID=200361 RepID=A0A453KAA7_AEGTS